MKKLVRCKSCGYIMAEDDLRDACPACGVPRAMFEPYADPLGPRRRRIIDLHLHPVAAHFPPSFSTSVLVLLIGRFFFTGRAGAYIVSTAKLIALFLPLFVFATFLVGLVDGKTRLRRIGRSQILKRKVFFGLLMFAFSIALALVVWTKGLESVLPAAVSCALAAGAVACAVVLGRLGIRIINSAFPGS